MIIGSSITIDTRPPSTGLHEAAYRDALVEALCRLARGLSGRRRVLLIDSSENLALLDERQEADGKGRASNRGSPRRSCPGLLAAGANLRVVLAGRERSPSGAGRPSLRGIDRMGMSRTPVTICARTG